MNPAAAGDGGGDAAAWTATESYGDEEEVTTTTGAKPCLVWVFRIINMILCVMMAATGAIGMDAPGQLLSGSVLCGPCADRSRLKSQLTQQKSSLNALPAPQARKSIDAAWSPATARAA